MASQLDGPSGTSEQRQAELGLEARDRAGEGGLRDAQQVRGASQVLLVGDGDELAEPGRERVDRLRHFLVIHICMINVRIMHWTYEPRSAYGGVVLDNMTRRPSTAKLRHTDPGMRQVRLGLFAAALATFALLYAPQPLLPQIAATFAVNPATASLAMSAATLALAIGVIPVSSLSEVFGRRRVMTVCALAASLLGLATTLAPSLPVLVAIRVLQGFALAGVPAVAMAYLAEEVERGSLGRAMGLFIAGNSIRALRADRGRRARRPRRL